MLSIVNECGAVSINCPNYLFGTKVNNTFDTCWYLLLTRLQSTRATSTDSNCGTSSPSLFWPTSFFVLPNNLIVSGDNNSCLYPVFTLKAILLLILLG